MGSQPVDIIYEFQHILEAFKAGMDRCFAAQEARMDCFHAKIKGLLKAPENKSEVEEKNFEDQFNDAPIKPTVVEGSDEDGSGSDEMGSRKVAEQFQERMQPDGNRVEQQETGNSSRSGILFGDKEEADQKHAKLLAWLRNQKHNKHPVFKPLSSQPQSAAEADKNHAELLSLLMNQKNNNHPVSHLFAAEIMTILINPSKSKQPVSPVGPFTHARKTFMQPEVVSVTRNPRERKIWDPGIMFCIILKQHLEDKVFVGAGVMI